MIGSSNRASPILLTPKRRWMRCSLLIKIALLVCVVLIGWQAYAHLSGSESSAAEHDIPVESSADGKVMVEVFYETLCPDSRGFVKQQLVPTYEKIANIMDFRLIPYGKAKTIETESGITFECQHRETECEGNKVHACATKYVEDKTQLLNYVACMISNNWKPEAVGEKCAVTYGINWPIIKECAYGPEGSQLLKGFGIETKALRPSVTFIPTITLNKSQGRQTDILRNLLKAVCQTYQGEKPPACLG